MSGPLGFRADDGVCQLHCLVWTSVVCLSGQGDGAHRTETALVLGLCGLGLSFGAGSGVRDLGTGAMCRGSDVKDQATACST